MSKRKNSIRRKVQFVIGLMLLLVIFLAGTGVYAVRLYKETVLYVGELAEDELPIASQMSGQVAQMRVIVGELKGYQKERDSGFLLLRKSDLGLGEYFQAHLAELYRMQKQYDKILKEQLPATNLHEHNRKNECYLLVEIEHKIEDLYRLVGETSVNLNNPLLIPEIDKTLGDLQILTDKMPKNLQMQFLAHSNDMKAQYQILLTTVCFSSIASLVILVMLMRLSYLWIFKPIKELVAGSRMVAQGRYNVRIKLGAKDEMQELADALNQMTEQFESVRNDLDQQVRIRTQEAVRTERLASVGFLAAGVAHEINNPLASIAMCAESLERRLFPLLEQFDNSSRSKKMDEEKTSVTEIVERYLNMIQEEAFRCKGITEKLLDFARMERKSREWTNMTELVSGMVMMLNHLGKYRNKQIKLDLSENLSAMVNPQEMKQVTLNLLTNALDCVDEGGIVCIRLFERDEHFHLVFEDDGCGMDSEILGNVFEPFFTKRQNGQGTGLGLSITHRIVTEHQGRIEAYSAGPGCGAVFQVEIPLTSPEARKLAAAKSKELAGVR